MILNSYSFAILRKTKFRLLVTFLLVIVTVLPVRSEIKGNIVLDTTKWSPVAYLSVIPDFTQINTISYKYIIERVNINQDGSFVFQSKFLPENEQLYRIHISKKGDPPSSLIIGGKDHNHFFVFANNESEIVIDSYAGKHLFNNLSFQGTSPNTALIEIKTMLNMLDSLDYFGATLNQDFIRESIYQRLRNYADTCSHPLLSLYAVYQSNYETDYMINPDYYRNFLIKWKNEESAYFKTFRKSLNEKSYSDENTLGIFGISIVTILILIVIIFKRKWKQKKSPLSTLTIQERNILTHLKQGKSNKEIAEECSISISTVKSHVNNIYSKLNVNSRKEVLDYNE